MIDEKRTAVVLAGGLGSRLHPYTLTIPKPLLPLDGIPIIEVVLRQLASQGFERVVISLGYHGGMIQYWVGDGSHLGVPVEYVTEETPLGTAGALHLIHDLPSSFIVMNGDLLTTLDFAEFLEITIRKGYSAGVALHRRSVAIDYGVVHVSDRFTVSGYEEKPVLEYQVSMGIYVLSREVQALVGGNRVDMPDLVRQLASRDPGVFAYSPDVYWQDIGRVDDYERASSDFAASPETFLRTGQGPNV